MGTKSETTYRSFIGHFTMDGVTTYNKTSKAYGKSRTGSSNPNWRKQIASVSNASTILTASEEKLEWWKPMSGNVLVHIRSNINQPWGIHNQSWSGYLEVYGHPVGVDDAVPAVPAFSGSQSDVNNQAIKQLYSKLNSYRHQLQGGVVLGEIRKTLQMIARPALALRQNVNGFRKLLGLRTRGAKKDSVPKIITDTYLEATFGWQPLLYDCRDACLALARMQMGLTPSRFRVFATDKTISNTSLFQNQDYTYAHIRILTVEGGQYTVVFYGAYQDSAEWNGNRSSLDKAIALSGFDLASWASTAWELLPYSFLADYFVNIGDVIMAAGVDTSAVRWLTKVVISERFRERTISGDSQGMAAWNAAQNQNLRYDSQNVDSGGFRTVTRSVSRTPTAVPPLALQITAPDLFSKHMLNIAALLTSKLF